MVNVPTHAQETMDRVQLKLAEAYKADRGHGHDQCLRDAADFIAWNGISQAQRLIARIQDACQACKGTGVVEWMGMQGIYPCTSPCGCSAGKAA